MSRIVRPPFHLRRLLALCLLPACAALPLQAWAADTDGDGVDDSIDAFPSNPEATTDTDSDGLPDTIDASKMVISFDGFDDPAWSGIVTSGMGWHKIASGHSGSPGLRGVSSYKSSGSVLSIMVYLPPAGAVVSYWHGYTRSPTCTSTSCTFNGVANSLFQVFVWEKSSYSVAGGSQTLRWTVGNCGGSFGGECGLLDDIEIVFNPSLVEDNDDDNDGVPDYIDAAPLNPSNSSERTLTLDSAYKGSAIKDGVQGPRGK